MMHRHGERWLAAMTTLVWTLSLGAEVRKTASVEGITEYRLDNGAIVLLIPDPSQPTVTVNLTVFVGSRHEGYGEGGMAHLLEHMVFKGTPTHPHIPRALQERGARFNGTTWFDRTNYFETLPASDENLEFALRLEADRLGNSLIRREDLLSEMTVVRNEFEMGENSPSRVLFQKMMAAAYEFHNYGKPTIGNRSDIERVPVENLREFYRRYYQPDNIMVIVAGRFDEKKALDYVQKYFGSLPRPKRALHTTYTEEPAQDGERTVILRRVGDVAIAALMYHIPAGSHPEFPAIQVLNSILSDTPSGRLYKALVTSGLASSVDGSALALHDPGILALEAEVRDPEKLEQVRDILIRETETIADKGIAPEEVERAKRKLLREPELAAGNTTQLAISLSNWAALGDWRLYFLHRDWLEKVDVEQVRSVAQKYLRATNRTTGLFVPTKQPVRVAIPARPDLKALVGNYRGRQAVAMGEQFDPTPENIQRRTRVLTLAENARAALLPKKTKNEVVELAVEFRYGDENSLVPYVTAAEILPQLLTRGAGRYSYQELQDELARLQARIRATGQVGQLTVTVECRRPTLPQVLSLLRSILREPKLSADEFAIVQRNALTELEQGRTEPMQRASRWLRRQLAPYPPGDVRYVPTLDEEIARLRELRVETVQDLYRKFLGADRALIAAVGDFDADALVEQLNEMLRGWRSAMPYRRITMAATAEQPATERIVTPDKANAVFLAGMVLPVRDDDQDYPALVMANYILGAGPLSSRLGDRIRQKEGLSYGVASQFRASAHYPRASLMVFAICNPANAPRVAQAVAEEIERLARDGVSSDELERAKKGYLQQQKVARTSDRQLTGLLTDLLDAHRSPAFLAIQEQRIAEVTPEQVQAVFRKYVEFKKFSVVTAGDFRDAASSGPGTR